VLDAHGRLDILVNNAGVTGFEDGPVAHDPEHASLEAWRAVHAVNLDGVFLGCKHGLRAMRRTGKGSIVNISSRSGLVGIPLAAAYAASKAGVRNHTKSVALYAAQEGLDVRCNSVHPAAIMTPMWEAMLGQGPGRAERERSFVRDTPMKRFGTPEEVAQVVVHLASDESGYTTGAEFVLDGGLLAGSAASPGLRKSDARGAVPLDAAHPTPLEAPHLRLPWSPDAPHGGLDRVLCAGRGHAPVGAGGGDVAQPRPQRAVPDRRLSSARRGCSCCSRPSSWRCCWSWSTWARSRCCSCSWS
jgi:NADP-dependent 3-hydroxy acid dehydrogenase YdfG